VTSGRRYPLEVLQGERARARRRGELELAAAIRAEAAAGIAVTAATTRLAAAERRAEDGRTSRARLLAPGVISTAATLAVADSATARLRGAVVAARGALTRATDELARSQVRVAAARGALADARADAELVDRHRGRWDDQQRKDRERREDG
jgi:hypothetical protein